MNIVLGALTTLFIGDSITAFDGGTGIGTYAD